MENESISAICNEVSSKLEQMWNLEKQIWCLNEENAISEFSEAGNILQGKEEDRGSERGAIRHILWQADITAEKYNATVATIIGNCHEQGRLFEPEKRFFFDIDEADSTVDQLNNIIGRKLGQKYSHLSSKERALKLIEFALLDGFYVARKNYFGYIIEKVQLGKESYQKLYEEFLKRDENGFLK